jgi:hypothetical protein
MWCNYSMEAKLRNGTTISVGPSTQLTAPRGEFLEIEIQIPRRLLSLDQGEYAEAVKAALLAFAAGIDAAQPKRRKKALRAGV